MQIINKIQPFRNVRDNHLEKNITKIILLDYILFLIINLMIDKEIKQNENISYVFHMIILAMSLITNLFLINRILEN